MKKYDPKKIVIRLLLVICFSFIFMMPAYIKAETAAGSQFTAPTVTFDGATIRSDSKSGIRFKITVSNASQADHCGIKVTYGGKSVTVSTEDENYRNIYAADKDADTVQYTVVVYGIPESAFSNNFTVQGFTKYKTEEEASYTTLQTDEFTRNIQAVADAARYEYNANTTSWKKMEDIVAAKTDGATTTQEEYGSMTVSFTGDYTGVSIKLPEGKIASDYDSVSFRVTCEEQFGVTLTDENGSAIKSAYPAYEVSEKTTNTYSMTFDTVDSNVTKTFSDGVYMKFTTLQKINGNAAKHSPITIHWLKYTDKKTAATELSSIKDTYADIFSHMGTCLTSNQLRSTTIMEFAKKQYNSFTLENEMKPEAILGSSVTKLSLDDASKAGYIIPDNYPESVVPQLNFGTVDATLELANANGIQMRAHTLLWHQQTPTWFFTTGYDGSEVTTTAIMDARLEFYIRNVMSHIMEKEKEVAGNYGDIVYAWDVVNEYINRKNSPTKFSWMDVYGDMDLEPTYVKKAYEIAYKMLTDKGLQDKVVLCYNDYNTYNNASNIVSLINYINKDENGNKICGAIGMQSHLDLDYPSVTLFGNTLDTFLATGLEVQITELDVTINYGQQESGGWGYANANQSNEDQATYIKSLMETIIAKHKGRDQSVNAKGITGVTLWGLYDSISWRSQCSPLLFGTSINDPKASFYSFIEAAAA